MWHPDDDYEPPPRIEFGGCSLSTIPTDHGNLIQIHLRLGELDDLIRALQMAKRHRRGCSLDYLVDQFRISIREPLLF